MACSKQFTITIDASSPCPSETATIATPPGGFGITAAKDAAVFRAVQPTNAGAGFQLINTSTNTVILTEATLSLPRAGCYAVTAARFCFADGAGSIQLITSAGAALTAVAPLFPSASIPAYNDVDDVVYFTGFDGGTGDLYVVEVNANTNSINSETIIGTAFFSRSVYFCPVPKIVITTGVSNPNTVEAFSIPGLGAAGSLALPGGFAFGVVYVSSIGKLLISTYDTIAPFNGLVLQVNPTTFAIEFTYDLGNVGGSDVSLDYNPSNDRVYAIAGADLFTINPVAQTVDCTLSPAGSAIARPSVDTASQNIYANNAAGNVLVFHH